MIKSLKSLNNVKEHIILDWSSDEEVKLNVENTKVLRIENEPYYWASRAYNFLINIVTSNYILKLDTDTLFNSEKFNKINYKDYDLIIFYKNKNDPGNFLIRKKIAVQINGFNEYIFGWGWEDHDFINRALTRIPKQRVLKIYDFIEKIDHPDSMRTKVKNSIVNSKNLHYAARKAHNQANSYISSLDLWNSSKERTYNYVDSKILHFYSFADTSISKRNKYKYIYLKTFFSILYPTKKVRHLVPILLFIFHHKIINQIFGVTIFPKKIK